MLRKLSSHPTARFIDDLPPVDLVAKYVKPAQGKLNLPHWFWVERKPNRGFDASGQATLRWRGRTYNVARVLLQHRHRARQVRAVNACGLPQCVRPEHWTVEPAFLGAVSGAPRGLATVRVGDAWRLSMGGEVVARDMAFVGTFDGPAAPPRDDPRRDMHVIRALHEEHETVFLTACGLHVDPAGVVAQAADATCERCLR